MALVFKKEYSKTFQSKFIHQTSNAIHKSADTEENTKKKNLFKTK